MADVKKIALYEGPDGEILQGVVTVEDGITFVQEVSGLDSMLQGGRVVGPKRALTDVKLLPWGLGHKIVLIGRNYAAHAKELGNEVPKEPLIFMKPTSALIGHGAHIELPPQSKEVHHEAELAAIVGKRLKNASEDECAKAIAGLTCLNDVSARDIQRAEVQFTRAKGFDTFCPVGPWVAVGLDWRDLRVQCRVNGETKQDGRTKDQIFALPKLLAFISAGMTLEPGDVISTGTPHGVGPFKAGDVVEIEIEGIGTLRNPARARD